MNVIYVNGPAGSGKDTFGLVAKDHEFLIEKFAFPIRHMMYHTFGIHAHELEERKKDEIFGMTIRQIMISFSEDWMKKKFGKGVLGYLAADRMLLNGGQNFVVTDCGFYEELHTCDLRLRRYCEKYGRQFKSSLVKIERPKHNYRNDSRGPVKPMADMGLHTIRNDGSIEKFQRESHSVMDEILQQ